MRTAILTTMVLIALSLPCRSDTKDVQMADPQQYAVKIIDDASAIPAVIEAGEAMSLSIPVVNTGSASVKADKIFITSCGCSNGRLAPSVLEPGQKGNIVFDPATTGSRVGIQTTKFVLQMTAQSLMPVTGEAQYFVKRDVSIAPNGVKLDTVQPGELFQRQLQVMVVTTGGPAHLTLSPKSDKLKAVTNDTRQKKGTIGENTLVTTFIVQIDGQAPDQMGNFSKQLDLVVGNLEGKDRVFPVHILGRVFAGVEMLPPRLFLGYVRPPQVVERTVTLTHRPGQVVEVKSIKDPEWLNTSYTVEHLSPEGTKISLRITATTHPGTTAGTAVLGLLMLVDGKPVTMEMPCVFVCPMS
jgi:hypothetical protein